MYTVTHEGQRYLLSTNRPKCTSLSPAAVFLWIISLHVRKSMHTHTHTHTHNHGDILHTSSFLWVKCAISTLPACIQIDSWTLPKKKKKKKKKHLLVHSFISFLLLYAQSECK